MGDEGDELIEVIADGLLLQTFTLSKSLENYEVTAPTHPTNVRVRFINDRYENGFDRNVAVEAVTVAGTEYSPMDAAVLSTGTYQQGNGCSQGNTRSVHLHCNGYFEFRIDAAPVGPVADGDTRVEIQAQGSTGEELIELRLGTEVLSSWTLSTDSASYIHDLSQSPAGQDLSVAFVNDARTDAGDRTVQVDFLAVDGQKIEAEDPAVYSEGSHTSSTGCAGGNKRSELLHCSGFMRFSIPADEPAIAPAIKAPVALVANAVEVSNDSVDETVAPEADEVEATAATSSTTTTTTTTTTTAAPLALADNGGAGDPETPTPQAEAAEPVTVAAFPEAGHNGQVGCVSDCKTVGFQNFDGKNGAVLENVIISNSGGPCLSINDASNITIRNVTLRNCATNVSKIQDSIVDITNSSNVAITNSKFIDNASRSVTNYDLIHVEDSKHVTIRNNEIRNVNSNTQGGSADKGNRAIRVTGNQVRDLTIDQNSFYNPGRNALQITRAQNITGVRFTNNRVEGNERWNTEFEDMLNFFSASGTSSSPIIVTGNYLRNGGPSASGTAIILGDGEGTASSGYINVERNVIVDPGHVGINVAGGHNFNVKDNIIYNGSDVGIWTATGLTINHYWYTPECRDHVISGNRVYFKNQHSQHNGTNHLWNPSTCRDNVKIYNNEIGDRSLSYDVWDLN